MPKKPRVKKTRPNKRAPKKRAPAKTRAILPELALRMDQAMEELQASHAELARLGHALKEAQREAEVHKMSLRSTESNLRAELDATRTDLKTALAELEIARAEVDRLRKKLTLETESKELS